MEEQSTTSFSTEEMETSKKDLREYKIYLLFFYTHWMFVSLAAAPFCFLSSQMILGFIFNWEEFAGRENVMWINLIGFIACPIIFAGCSFVNMITYGSYVYKNKIVLSPRLLGQDELLLQSTTGDEDVDELKTERKENYPLGFWPSSGLWKNWEWTYGYTYCRAVFYLFFALEIPCVVVILLFLFFSPGYCFTIGADKCDGKPRT